MTNQRNLREFEYYDRTRVRDEASLAVEMALEASGARPADLARSLDNSRPYVTKILRTKPNFTITKLADVLRSLGFHLHFSISRKPWEFVPPRIEGSDHPDVNRLLRAATEVIVTADFGGAAGGVNVRSESASTNCLEAVPNA